MKKAETMAKELNTDFSTLTDENRERVLEMTKFLVLTQNTIIPEMIKPSKKEEGKIWKK
jgi:hypothetical protein